MEKFLFIPPVRFSSIVEAGAVGMAHRFVLGLSRPVGTVLSGGCKSLPVRHVGYLLIISPQHSQCRFMP